MKKFLALFLSIFISQAADASQQNQPANCPSASMIASVGVDKPFVANGNWNVAAAKNQYGTQEWWSFVFLTGLDEYEATPEQAVVLANSNINKLFYSEGPLDIGDDDPQFWCFYRSQNNKYIGAAMTPPAKFPDLKKAANKHSFQHS